MATVFLDLDGTLVDPKPGITGSVVHALLELGLPAPDTDSLTWVIGPPLLDSFRKLGVPDPALALHLYRERYAKTGLFDAEMYPGIPDILAALQAAGHRLHLATAKPHVYARQITAHFGLAQFLDHQFGPELNGTRNDKGDLLAHALDRLRLRAEKCVMVGDRHHDVDAAAAVGMASIGVSWGYGALGELDRADAICASPSKLPWIVDQVLGR